MRQKFASLAKLHCSKGSDSPALKLPRQFWLNPRAIARRVSMFWSIKRQMAETATKPTIYEMEKLEKNETMFVSYKRLKTLKSLPRPERGLCPASFLFSPHNLWSQYPHPRHVFPLCFHSLSFIINSHILHSLKLPPIPNSFFPPCTHFSRYWPRPPVPVPGGCHGGWASHSQGCSVHSSHRLPWGLPLSTAVGCLPTMKERG